MCHKEIDIHNPLRLSGTPGFTQEERQWLDVLDAEGWRDGFRIFNSESENYTWWSYQSNSRSRNVGWRIDAFWLSPKASQGAKRCIHLYKPELSDHCPVLLDWEMPSIFT
jgi:exodeoxyribonuclease-3